MTEEKEEGVYIIKNDSENGTDGLDTDDSDYEGIALGDDHIDYTIFENIQKTKLRRYSEPKLVVLKKFLKHFHKCKTYMYPIYRRLRACTPPTFIDKMILKELKEALDKSFKKCSYALEFLHSMDMNNLQVTTLLKMHRFLSEKIDDIEGRSGGPEWSTFVELP
uniref:Uncharacterized protein n=1 Tax=Bracon brevicornis TaxID=1563983 RepID=A0A6V7JXL6_9HYME